MDMMRAAKIVRKTFIMLGRRLDTAVSRISCMQLLQMSVDIQGSTTGIDNFFYKIHNNHIIFL